MLLLKATICSVLPHTTKINKRVNFSQRGLNQKPERDLSGINSLIYIYLLRILRTNPWQGAA